MRFTQFTIDLPANVVGEFEMNFQENVVVNVNNKPVNLSFGTIRLEPGTNQIDIRINSF